MPQYRLTHHQAVWEECRVVVDIPDAAWRGEYDSVREYVADRLDTLLAEAQSAASAAADGSFSLENTESVDGIDDRFDLEPIAEGGPP
jgi:hypothetical protein